MNRQDKYDILLYFLLINIVVGILIGAGVLSTKLPQFEGLIAFGAIFLSLVCLFGIPVLYVYTIRYRLEDSEN